jgi:uncharacterized protein YbjT (DUF2867 family)
VILVVGATGQLGTAVVKRLLASSKRVRAFARASSSSRLLPGAEPAIGDLLDSRSVERACRGADAVICTANSIVPRRGDRFGQVELEGYANLLDASRKNRVGHFVFISAPVTPFDARVPIARWKRWNEDRIRESGIPYTFFRASLFMDSWLALIGSRLPLRGSENATLRRPFWFSRRFFGVVGDWMDRKGRALIPGPGDRCHSFLAVEDAAAFLVRSLGLREAENAVFDLGGPEALTWYEVIQIYSRVLGKQVRALHVPPAVYRAQQFLWRPFSAAAANQMGLNWLVASSDLTCDMSETAPLFGVPLTSVEEFLERKALLGADAEREPRV